MLTLLLLCAVQFLDFADGSITNVALPAIQRGLHFSQQSLQWVTSGYVLTYGGLLLFGGRAADLLGRRRVLVGGLSVFAACSLAAGLAHSEEILIAGRLAQGVGAALMAPAALSILTTTFEEGSDRHTAVGAWGAMSGLGAAAGVFLGGVLSEGPGWRWVFYVNIPICALAVAATFRLIEPEHRRAPLTRFDTAGAVTVTGGMLLLLYTLIKAPDVGWGTTRTIGLLAASVAILVLFVLIERRSANPLAPLSIFRIKGLAAADATQMLAIAGFFSMFFFVTLYMQEVLRFSPIQAGAAYLPVTACLAIAAAGSSQLFTRLGTRPVIITGAALGAAGVYYLSRVPIHGSYVSDVLPGLIVMAVGLGSVIAGVTTAATTGVPGEDAGLAAGLLSASQQLGIALGLAIFSAIATARTHDLLMHHVAKPLALDSGYQRALIACSGFIAIAGVIASRTANTRSQAVLVPVPPSG
jgi:EmrB/QacA subfamily drug resistance transporter